MPSAMQPGIVHLNKQTWLDALEGTRRAYHARYYAMYSTLWDGAVTDPVLMHVPVDDHVAHRGDGVFESFKCVAGRLYNLEAHLDRLGNSARALQMTSPLGRDELRRVIIETTRLGGHEHCAVRVLLSRGPGGLGANPYESPRQQLYVIAYELGDSFMKKHPGGARVALSQVPAKPAFYAQVKSCNYLANVLMAREAVDRGLDFVVGLDEAGCLTEGATENIMLVTETGELLSPQMGQVLAGTTLQRVMTLAHSLVQKGLLSGVALRDITPDMAASAREMFIVGTTRDVIAVVEFEGRPVGAGRPGPLFERLADLLERDIRYNEDLLTRVF